MLWPLFFSLLALGIVARWVVVVYENGFLWSAVIFLGLPALGLLLLAASALVRRTWITYEPGQPCTVHHRTLFGPRTIELVPGAHLQYMTKTDADPLAPGPLLYITGADGRAHYRFTPFWVQDLDGLTRRLAPAVAEVPELVSPGSFTAKYFASLGPINRPEGWPGAAQDR